MEKQTELICQKINLRDAMREFNDTPITDVGELKKITETIGNILDIIFELEKELENEQKKNKSKVY